MDQAGIHIELLGKFRDGLSAIGEVNKLGFEFVGKLSSGFHDHSVLFLVIRGPEISLTSGDLNPFWFRGMLRTHKVVNSTH